MFLISEQGLGGFAALGGVCPGIGGSGEGREGGFAVGDRGCFFTHLGELFEGGELGLCFLGVGPCEELGEGKAVAGGKGWERDFGGEEVLEEGDAGEWGLGNRERRMGT